MKILTLGCGYVGATLGTKLQMLGHEITGVVRTPESAKALQASGFKVRIADCSIPKEAVTACEGEFDVVVFAISSKGSDYQCTYVQGMQNVLSAFSKGEKLPRLFFYTSSTSVYTQTDGEWVDENSPCQPLHENGKFLLQTEQLLSQAAKNRFSTYILRLSGIYGPGRHAMVDKLRAGIEALPGDGLHWINQIHRDDVVSAIIHLISKFEGQNSKFESRILNISDHEPIVQHDYVAWLCERLNRPVPSYNPKQKVVSRRGHSFQPNRRISTRALCKTGWTPIYPSFREGLANCQF